MNQTPEFLQSENWLAFQASVGKEIVRFSSDGFVANGIIHQLLLVGKYLYIPRGPISENVESDMLNFKKSVEDLIALAKEKNAKWIRIEPQIEETLQKMKEVFDGKTVRASHDMQPKEIFVMDITSDEEILMAQMKPKTRYNIRLAEKHGVKAFATRDEKYKQAFFDLISATSDRKEIVPHPRAYYEHFFSVFPAEICQLFVAEYNGEILAANILITFEGRAIYLHGGSSSIHRGVMAPYLLQWEQIRYAKEQGCREYDFGGVHTEDNREEMQDEGEKKMKSKKSPITHHSSIITHAWDGITRFKKGFSPQTTVTVFPGSYDMVLDSKAYFLYNFLRRSKEIIRSINIFK